MNPEAIAAFVAVGVASPLLGYVAHLLIDVAKVRKAHRALEAEPLVFEGSRFSRLLCAAGTELMGPGQLLKLEPGRVLVGTDDGRRMPFTGQQFQAMHPEWITTDQELDAAAADPDLGKMTRTREGTFS